MHKITVNGIELEIDANCDIEIDGSKIKIRAKGAEVVEKHEYHWHMPVALPVVQSFPTYPTWSLPGVICGNGGAGHQNGDTLGGVVTFNPPATPPLSGGSTVCLTASGEEFVPSITFSVQ